ncbi:dihydrolipoyl dehydrogenase family protein [Nitratidesulfovibrio sp. SRB-5]|uniref:dihydrolipoyl dehydrogenase family protein n=1 Tax=Nitratidesulfovibrio sp. SRB-5 TaxID=2872636 RepID=UPI001CBE99BF|nr:FAD-dependent oxidoreductase [Nitratidesulfovibrio sp. SRB-5]MBZ2172786.1 FAD-dependent oxidoreductase [Nitratidesulfovibrio sp. SRB-5]
MARTPRHDADLLVIGGGAAGLTAAAGAARFGARVVLAEREPALGGDCLHHGCVPSKTLLATARARHVMRRAALFGLPAPELEPVDFAAVARRIREVQAVIQRHDSPQRFTGLGVDVRFGPARFCDEHTVDIGGRRVSAARILIATGSSPQLPPLPGLDTVPFLTNRELFSLDALPASLLVLGGGPMACEMAQAFARLGSRVTMVLRGPRILPRDDADMAGVVHASLAADGVRVLAGATVKMLRAVSAVSAVSGSSGSSGGLGESGGLGKPGEPVGPDGNDAAGTGVEAELEVPQGEGRGPLVVRADRLLAALGRTPETAGLDLAAAGVATGRHGGITVDGRMRTSQPHVFAAGDVTGDWQFTHAAGHEAGVVVANAVLRLPRRADHARMPWCTFTDPELASVGCNERMAAERGLPVDVHVEPFASNDRALAEGTPEGRLKLVLRKGGNRVLGVQAVGPHAGEVLNEWVAVLGGGVRLSALAGAVHPYPTLGEISARAAGNVVSRVLFSAGARRLLRLLFGYRG